MASGYEKINAIKSKLKVKTTVRELANLMGCGPRTIFRHLETIGRENCGLRKFKEGGETYYVIQTQKEFNFNQEMVKQLEKVKKNFLSTSAPDIKTGKILDKVIGLLQTTDPNDFKPEAISTDPDYVLDYGPFCDNKLQDAMVNRVLKAIHDGFTVRISYRHASASEGQETKEVNPVKVIMRMDTLYLVAGEMDEKGNQIFKNYLFENILNVMETSHQAPVFTFDAALHYKYTFGKYTVSGKPEDVSLEVKASSKWLQTQFEKSHFNPEITKRYDKNKNMIVDMKLRITPDFKTWLMGMSTDIRILKPVALKEEIKSMLKKALSEMDG